jgi:hypothetical protein
MAATSDEMLQDPGVVRQALLMKLEFLSETKWIWNDRGPLYVAGQTWEGVGAVVSVTGVESVPGTTAHPMTITMSGVDPKLIPLALDAAEYKGRPFTLWQCLFDEAFQPVEPILFRGDGYMDLVLFGMPRGDERTLTLTVESIFADRGFATHSTYSAESLNHFFPDDLGMVHQAGVANGARAVWPIVKA